VCAEDQRPQSVRRDRAVARTRAVNGTVKVDVGGGDVIASNITEVAIAGQSS